MSLAVLNFFKRIPIVVCCSLSLILAYGTWPHGLVRSEDYLSACLVISLIFLFLILSLAVVNRTWYPDLEIAPGFFGSFLLLLIVNAFVSIDRYQSVLETLKAGSIVMVSLCFYRLREERFICPFACLLVLAGAFYSLYGLAQAKGYVGHAYWAEPGEVSSRLINSTHFAGFLLIPLLAGIGILFSNASLLWKIVPMVSLPILGFTLVKTASRSGWLCFVLGAAVYVFLVERSKWKMLSRPTKVLRAFLILCIFMIGIYFVGVHGYQRIATLWQTGFQTLTQRGEVLATSALVLLNYPLGIGAGNLFRLSPQFKVVSDRFLVDYSHNELLQLAVEFGLLGLLIVLWLLIVYQKRMQSFFRYLDSKTEMLSAQAGLYAGVLALAAQSLVDFPMRIPSNALLVAGIVGYQLGLAKIHCSVPNANLVRLNTRPWFHKAFSLMLLAGTLAVAIESWRLQSAQKYLDKGRQLAGRFLWKESERAYRIGSLLAPADAVFDTRLGELFIQRSVVARDKTPWLQAAANSLQTAWTKSPRDTRTQIDLAKTHDALGNLENAEIFYKLRIVENPKDGIPYVRCGYFLLDHGLFMQAADFLRLPSSLTLLCEDPEGASSLERFYAKTQKYQQLNRLAGGNFGMIMQLAWFLQSKGAMTDFDQAAEQLLAMAPDKLQAALQLLQWVADRGDQGRIRDYARKVLRLDPSNTYAHDILKRSVS